MADQDCPRGTVAAQIFNKTGNFLGGAQNSLIKAHQPCKCNDNLDTLVEGSKTCLAIHAEVLAVMDVWSQGHSLSSMHSIWVSRPPCRNCLKVLLATDIQEIVVSSKHVMNDRDNSKEVWLSANRKWDTIK